MLDPKWYTWYMRYWVEILDHWSRVGVEVAARRKSGCTKYLAAPPYILILGYGCQPNFSSSDLISPSHLTFSWPVDTHTRYLLHMVHLRLNKGSVQVSLPKILLVLVRDVHSEMKYGTPVKLIPSSPSPPEHTRHLTHLVSGTLFNAKYIAQIF